MLPLNASQIPSLLNKARAMEKAGQLEAAQTAYESVLKIDAKHVVAHFQLGQLYYNKGDAAGSLRHLDQAAKLNPKEPLIWKALAKVTAEQANPTANQAFLKKAKKARLDRKLLLTLQEMFHASRSKTSTAIGDASPADVKRAIDLLQAGRAKEAAKLATTLRRAHPNVAIIADILANALAAIGQPDDAEENFKASIRLDPDYAEARSNYGRFLVERGRVSEGIAELVQALKLAPKMARAMVHLGVAHHRDHNPRGAEVALRRALKLMPDNSEALITLGEVLVGDGQSDEALVLLERAERFGADKDLVMLWRARALSGQGLEDDAMALFDDLIARNERNTEALIGRALICQSLGRFDEARAGFRAAIAIEPKAGRFYRHFLTSEKLAADDPLIPQMEAGIADPDISDMGRVNFGFALAKAMEDSKQYKRVFTYLKPANDLMRAVFPYDINKLRDQNEALKEQLRGIDFGADIAKRSEYAPIFVTGLPRSGTTLVEQIVASHSKVTGGGELGFARIAWGEALIDANSGVRPWSAITQKQIVEIGQSVAAQMQALYAGAEVVTDKSVQSYTLIGPILASLPKARFVVVKRDPRDNLLSMYKNMFAAGKHLHSYNLRDLAIYYRLFEDILEFWQEQLPGAFHLIQYEELIADPEAMSRDLIAACGLDWEDECMNFHKTSGGWIR